MFYSTKDFSEYIPMFFNVLLITLYLINLAAMFILFYIIFCYLKDKPLGRQTLFDLMVCDLLIAELVVISMATVGKSLYEMIYVLLNVHKYIHFILFHHNKLSIETKIRLAS